MVKVVVVIFVVCQLPYYVIEIISIEVMKTESLPGPTWRKVFSYFYMFAQNLVFVSSCCNPIVYGVYNRNYSKIIMILYCVLQGRHHHWT